MFWASSCDQAATTAPTEQEEQDSGAVTDTGLVDTAIENIDIDTSMDEPNTSTGNSISETTENKKTQTPNRRTETPSYGGKETLYISTYGANGKVWGHVTMNGKTGRGTIHDDGENSYSITVTRHGGELYGTDQNGRQYVFKM